MQINGYYFIRNYRVTSEVKFDEQDTQYDYHDANIIKNKKLRLEFVSVLIIAYRLLNYTGLNYTGYVKLINLLFY